MAARLARDPKTPYFPYITYTFYGIRGSLSAESMFPAGVNPTPDQLEATFDRKWVIFVIKRAV